MIRPMIRLVTVLLSLLVLVLPMIAQAPSAEAAGGHPKLVNSLPPQVNVPARSTFTIQGMVARGPDYRTTSREKLEVTFSAHGAIIKSVSMILAESDPTYCPLGEVTLCRYMNRAPWRHDPVMCPISTDPYKPNNTSATCKTEVFSQLPPFHAVILTLTATAQREATSSGKILLYGTYADHGLSANNTLSVIPLIIR